MEAGRFYIIDPPARHQARILLCECRTPGAGTPGVSVCVGGTERGTAREDPHSRAADQTSTRSRDRTPGYNGAGPRHRSMSDPNYLEYLKLKRHGLLEDTTHTKPITLTPSENQQGYQGGGRSRKHGTWSCELIAGFKLSNETMVPLSSSCGTRINGMTI